MVPIKVLDLVMCQIIQSHILVKTHAGSPFQIQVPTVTQNWFFATAALLGAGSLFLTA